MRHSDTKTLEFRNLSRTAHVYAVRVDFKNFSVALSHCRIVANEITGTVPMIRSLRFFRNNYLRIKEIIVTLQTES